jgi:hypothetical protein
VTTGLSEAEFKRSILGGLAATALGRPIVFPDAVWVPEWVNGVGLEVGLIVRPAPGPAGLETGKHYAAPTLAFAKAVAAQI